MLNRMEKNKLECPLACAVLALKESIFTEGIYSSLTIIEEIYKQYSNYITFEDLNAFYPSIYNYFLNQYKRSRKNGWTIAEENLLLDYLELMKSKAKMTCYYELSLILKRTVNSISQRKSKLTKNSQSLILIQKQKQKQKANKYFNNNSSSNNHEQTYQSLQKKHKQLKKDLLELELKNINLETVTNLREEAFEFLLKERKQLKDKIIRLESIIQFANNKLSDTNFDYNAFNKKEQKVNLFSLNKKSTYSVNRYGMVSS